MKTTELVKTNGSRELVPALRPEDISDGAISTIDRATILRTPAAEQIAVALKAMHGRPLADRILVLPLPMNDHYGSVLVPESAQEDQACGIVVAVGKGRYENGALVKPEVTEGNYVVFSKYAARKIQIGDVEVMQITEPDINFAAGEL